MHASGDTAPARPHRNTTLAEWLPLLRDVLVAEGSLRLPLHGDSMRPTLPGECEVEVLALPAAPALGSLIIFASQDELIAHRLVGRHGQQWIAQGDGRRGPDRPLAPTDVLGIVSAAYVAGQRIWPPGWARVAAGFWIARYHVLRPLRAARRWARRKWRRPASSGGREQPIEGRG